MDLQDSAAQLPLDKSLRAESLTSAPRPYCFVYINMATSSKRRRVVLQPLSWEDTASRRVPRSALAGPCSTKTPPTSWQQYPRVRIWGSRHGQHSSAPGRSGSTRPWGLRGEQAGESNSTRF